MGFGFNGLWLVAGDDSRFRDMALFALVMVGLVQQKIHKLALEAYVGVAMLPPVLNQGGRDRHQFHIVACVDPRFRGMALIALVVAGVVQQKIHKLALVALVGVTTLSPFPDWCGRDQRRPGLCQ